MHNLHLVMWFIFYLKRRKMGLVSFASLFKLINGLVTFILFIHGKHCSMAYLSYRVCGRCGPDVVHSSPMLPAY
jgi:hypothetical protein